MCAEYQDDYGEIARRKRDGRASPSLRVRRAETQPRWEIVVRAEFARRAELPGVPPTDDFTLRIIIATGLSAFRVSLEIWMHDPIKSFERIVAEAFRHLARGFDAHKSSVIRTWNSSDSTAPDRSEQAVTRATSSTFQIRASWPPRTWKHSVPAPAGAVDPHQQ